MFIYSGYNSFIGWFAPISLLWDAIFNILYFIVCVLGCVSVVGCVSVASLATSDLMKIYPFSFLVVSVVSSLTFFIST